jgi:hypothetical protein
LSQAYTRFAGVVGSSSTKIIQALNAVTQALINFGTAAAGLALSVSVAENAVAGPKVGTKAAGGIIEAFASGGVLQTLSAPGASEHALHRAGSALAAADHSAAYALVGERGYEIASPDLSLFGLNNKPSQAYEFGYQQALNPTANISFVGTRGPELVRTRQSLAILNHTTSKAYIEGYRMALQGYQHGGVIHADVPHFASGGFINPAALASFSNGGTIINEDNSMSITVIVEGGANVDAEELADGIVERIDTTRETEKRRKKDRLNRQL